MNDTLPTGIARQPFGTLPDGRPAYLYTLKHPGGPLEVRITNFGAAVTHLFAPDRDGTLADVVMGYDSLADYLDDSTYFGAVVGRYGNRIAGGRFSLDDKTYTLATNNSPNHLHGGERGFDKVLWEAEPLTVDGSPALRLRYTSPHLEEGYPGALGVRITYALRPDRLEITYEATTDHATVVNLTNHSYFNLGGDFARDVLDHELMIRADRFVPTDSVSIPTGELAPVEATPFDFRTAKRMGAQIDADHPQLAVAQGYDHTFVLKGDSMRAVAEVMEPATGRTLVVHTDEPGMQFYTANFLSDTDGKGGVVYRRRHGFCLETQHYPDSPNQPDFPSVVLRPGETYRSRTAYAFGVAQ
ncbi:MAG: aldose epimerase family protein [Catalinimonas sp.]